MGHLIPRGLKPSPSQQQAEGAPSRTVGGGPGGRSGELRTREVTWPFWMKHRPILFCWLSFGHNVF